MKRTIVLFTVSLLIGNAVFAQVNNVWKKTVYRVLELPSNEETAKHHLTDVTSAPALVDLMASAIKSGKLTAYNGIDHKFSTKFPKGSMTDKTDTVMVVDPTNNREHEVIVKREFNLGTVHKYRLFEEWTFDPASGKTDIHIEGIAPLKEIYGDNGVFRGVQVIFWVRYADARDVLAQYDKLHPSKTFASLLWDDYFLSDIKPSVQN